MPGDVKERQSSSIASVVLSQEGEDADLLGSGLVIPCEESGTEKLDGLLWTVVPTPPPQRGWTGRRAAALLQIPCILSQGFPTGGVDNQPPECTAFYFNKR